MSELREWLRRHNLEQYADAFEANDIGMDILPELSERDLEQLGLSLGNRRRLLKAVAGRAMRMPNKMKGGASIATSISTFEILGSTANR